MKKLYLNNKTLLNSWFWWGETPTEVAPQLFI
jgi:hypothetical protein